MRPERISTVLSRSRMTGALIADALRRLEDGTDEDVRDALRRALRHSCAQTDDLAKERDLAS